MKQNLPVRTLEKHKTEASLGDWNGISDFKKKVLSQSLNPKDELSVALLWTKMHPPTISQLALFIGEDAWNELESTCLRDLFGSVWTKTVKILRVIEKEYKEEEQSI